jgi:iron complex transport system ATP-binding protein
VTLLQFDDVSVTLGGQTVLDRVNLEMTPGEVVGVIGPNGAGKTTLLKAGLGLWPAHGVIRLAGRPIDALSRAARARLVAYVPQERDVAWAMDVATVVSLGRLPYGTSTAIATAANRALVARAMQDMDIADFGSRIISELSGGERARVLMARALAQDTPLLLADEPASGLDPEHQIRLLELLRRRAGDGQSIVVTLHDLQAAARWCDRLILLKDGRVVADGPPLEVLTEARIAEVYNCAAFVGTNAAGPMVIPTGLAVDEPGCDVTRMPEVSPTLR